MKKFLIHLLVFLGISKVYAGTSKVFFDMAKESSESSQGDNCDRPTGGCSGCTRC